MELSEILRQTKTKAAKMENIRSPAQVAVEERPYDLRGVRGSARFKQGSDVLKALLLKFLADAWGAGKEKAESLPIPRPIQRVCSRLERFGQTLLNSDKKPKN